MRPVTPGAGEYSPYVFPSRSFGHVPRTRWGVFTPFEHKSQIVRRNETRARRAVVPFVDLGLGRLTCDRPSGSRGSPGA